MWTELSSPCEEAGLSLSLSTKKQIAPSVQSVPPKSKQSRALGCIHKPPVQGALCHPCLKCQLKGHEPVSHLRNLLLLVEGRTGAGTGLEKEWALSSVRRGGLGHGLSVLSRVPHVGSR